MVLISGCDNGLAFSLGSLSWVSVFLCVSLSLLCHHSGNWVIFLGNKCEYSLTSSICSICVLALIDAAAAAKSLQSCPTLCDPTDGSPPGSPTPGILQARILEWVAISFSNAWKWKVKVKSLSCVRLLVTSWTAAYQAPPSIVLIVENKQK